MSDIQDIIANARADMIARHSEILDVERDIIEPHKPPFVYYDDFLNSLYWKERSAERMRAANYTCQECGASDTLLNTHHLTYERLGDELDEDLIVLCRDCHRSKHGT